MELKVHSRESDKLEVEFVGERKSVLHLLKETLLEDDKVTMASVISDHPTLGHPHLVLRTSSGKPETALKRAASSARKNLDELEDLFLDAIE